MAQKYIRIHMYSGFSQIHRSSEIHRETHRVTLLKLNLTLAVTPSVAAPRPRSDRARPPRPSVRPTESSLSSSDSHRSRSACQPASCIFPSQHVHGPGSDSRSAACSTSPTDVPCDHALLLIAPRLVSFWQFAFFSQLDLGGIRQFSFQIHQNTYVLATHVTPKCCRLRPEQQGRAVAVWTT